MNHQFKNRAGGCVIRDFDVFVDSNCTVKANSVDDDVVKALDVANTISTHSSQQCGVVGHLFPFDAPFGKVNCNATHIDMTSYEDFQCTQQLYDTNSYRWGSCQFYPWTTRGVKFIKMYQNQRAPAYAILANNTSTDYTVDARLLFTLSSGLILLACVISCMGFSIYQIKQSSSAMSMMGKGGKDMMGVNQTEMSNYSNYMSGPNNMSRNTNFNINP